jgi:hypothetical protein
MGHKQPSESRFAMDLRSVLPEIEETRPRKNGARLRYWKGIRLVSKMDDLHEPSPPSDDALWSLMDKADQEYEQSRRAAMIQRMMND